ncbi:MAG: patatin [Betaproteobacteria bacterium]|nr:patatin [Betaproteobacteria bacterium]
MYRPYIHILLQACATALAVAALATTASATEGQRPRIGLVLGGGGARGAAHVGVLKKLQELKIPVDCVAGTSMGGLVAGAFSSGLSPSEMQIALKEADWRDMFSDSASYADFTPRLKGSSQSYIPGSEGGLKNGTLQFPSAVLSGQKIKFFIDRLVRANAAPQRIEGQPLPLALVTTDIVTGATRVWRSGDLATLMRATMSVPGLMAPVKYEGLSLVDGGLVDNVPIAQVQQLCQPDVVIAVNVGSPLLKAEDIDASPLAVTGQMINLLTEQNVTQSLTRLRPGVDVYIRPGLDGITAGDFERSEETIARGYAAAAAAEPELRRLAASEEQYAAWQRSVSRQALPDITVQAIHATGLPPTQAQVLTEKLDTKPGATLSVQTLENDLLKAYGEGKYSNVAYQLVQESDATALNIVATEKPWGPDLVRAGVNFSWGTSEEARYNIRGAYHQTRLNEDGGELLLTGQLGSDNALGADFYQPLDAASAWFVQSQGFVGTYAADLYQNGTAQARFRVDVAEINGGLGLNLGRYGVLKSGLLQRHQRAETTIGSSSLLGDNTTVDNTAWFISADLDRFNSPFFPTAGWRARLTQTRASDYTKLDGSYAQSFSLGAYVLTGRMAFTRATDGTLPISDSASLGGTNNLTGLAHGQIVGSDMRYLGVRSEKIIGRMPLGMRGDLRLGLSYEAGSMQQRYSETQGSGIIRSSGVYLGGETPLGPLYLGVAKASENDARLFLFLGNP